MIEEEDDEDEEKHEMQVRGPLREDKVLGQRLGAVISVRGKVFRLLLHLGQRINGDGGQALLCS